MIPFRLNPDWYRVKYNLAVLHANWAADLVRKRKHDEEAEERGQRAAAIHDHRHRAHGESSELLEAALKQLVECPGETNPALQRLLEGSIVPATLIIYGATWKNETEKKFAGSFVPANLKDLLGCLRNGLLNDETAFEYVELHVPPTARTNYNLACAYAETGDTKAAMEHLKEALRRGSASEREQLRHRAATDPSLATLRKLRAWRSVVAPKGHTKGEGESSRAG